MVAVSKTDIAASCTSRNGVRAKAEGPNPGKASLYASTGPCPSVRRSEDAGAMPEATPVALSRK